MQNPWLNCGPWVFAFLYNKAVVLLGRHIRCCTIGTTTDFSDNADRFGEIHQIRNADVYWGDNGNLIVVASEKWKQYLTGESEVIPDDDELDSRFEFDDKKFAEMVMGYSETE